MDAGGWPHACAKLIEFFYKVSFNWSVLVGASDRRLYQKIINLSKVLASVKINVVLWKKIAIICAIGFLKEFENFKFVYDTSNFCVRVFQKCIYFFFNFEFIPIFWKNQYCDFFFKNNFLIKISENLSTYFSYDL